MKKQKYFSHYFIYYAKKNCATLYKGIKESKNTLLLQ